MADGNWLTPRQVNALGHEEQQEYNRQRLNEMREETSDDEQLSDMDVDGVNADDSDCEEVQLPEFDPETDSEDDEECDLPSEAGQLYTGRDGTIWSTTPPNTGRFRTHNILRCARHGPVQRTNGLSILETFKLIMSEEIFDIIIRETNRKAKKWYNLKFSFAALLLIV